MDRFHEKAGGKPNLNNIDLKEICGLSEACEVSGRLGRRLNNLKRMTGVSDSAAVLRGILPVARELVRIPPKRVLRGKFEAWFFVEFWKSLVKQLQQLAQESGGRIDVKLPLEHGTFVTVMAGHVEFPRSLELFLSAHFPRDPDADQVSPQSGKSGRIQDWWDRLQSRWIKG